MSVNLTNPYINQQSPYFLLVNSQLINTSTLNANQVSTGSLIVDDIDINGAVFVSSIYATGEVASEHISSATGRISTFFTQQITLDQATLNVAGGNTLLLNGVPVATINQLSNISDWSLYPAISNVDFDNYSLTNVGNINCQNITNALNVGTDTLAVGTSLTSPIGLITNVRATNISTINSGNAFLPNISTFAINGQPYQPPSLWATYPAVQNVSMNGNNIVGGSNLTITTSNLSLVASNSLSNTCRDFNLVADEGVNLGSVANINLTAQNGTYGAVNITANGGFNNAVNGVVNITANGSQVGGVGQGGSINLTANTPSGFSNLTSKISLNASGINSYAGVVPPIASLAGYNFIYGTGGVNICAGLPAGALPNTAGTVYLYGLTGVEVPSQAYMSAIEPYWDGITTPGDLEITGRYIIPNLAQVCLSLSNVRNLDFQSNVATRITNIDSISMSNGAITGVNTINGSPYPPGGGGGITTAQLTSTTVGLGTLNYISSSQLISTVAGLGTPTIGPNLLNISSLSGYNLQLSTVSSIYGRTTSGSSNYYSRVIEFDYNPPTGVGGMEICVSGKAQNAGAVASASLGTDVQRGSSYIQSVWDGNISMPFDFYGANFNFQSDADYILYLDGQAGAPATLSTGFTFYMASTITQTNQHLTANVRQPFIQYGNFTTSGASGSNTVNLPVAYADVHSFVAQVSMNDTSPAQMSVVNVDSNVIDVYWANGGAGSHSINWTTFGDI